MVDGSVVPAVVEDEGGELVSITWSPPPGLTLDGWASAVKKMTRASAAINWLIGDALLWGTEQFGELAEQFMDEFGLSYGQLADLKWVAKSFPPERRRRPVSWSHHRELAKLETSSQEEWLDKCEEEGWSRTMLRQQLREQGLLPVAKSMTDVEYLEAAVNVVDDSTLLATIKASFESLEFTHKKEQAIIAVLDADDDLRANVLAHYSHEGVVI